MNISLRPLVLVCVSLSLSACSASKQAPPVKVSRVKVITLQLKDVTLTQQYVGQIKSHHHIDIRAPQSGNLEAVEFNAGQAVRQGDLLFRLTSTPGSVSQAAGNLSSLLLVKAPFDGIVDRPQVQQGSFVKQAEVLTNLSDNSMMWVYFNVPEVRYLEFISEAGKEKEDQKIELVLASGKKFDHPGKLGAIQAVFNPETGSVPFRADFPNPDRLLRHGQRGTVLLSRVKNDAIVVPQHATFEILAKRYVYVVDNNNVAHQREIAIQSELDNEFVIKSGVAANEMIVVDGIREIYDGSKVEFETTQPEKVAVTLEHHVDQEQVQLQ